MLWKELFVARVPAFYRPVGLAVALALSGLLAWGTVDFALPAFREALAVGYGPAVAGSARAAFLGYLRIVGTGLALVFALGIASDAAAGIASEREKDTWIGLAASPLTGLEVVRAKILGAIWGTRHAAAVLLVLWLAGVSAGAIHPIGPVLVAAELAALGGFAAALGTWVSLRSSETLRATARVMALLLLIEAGPLIVVPALTGTRPLALAGSAPALMAASLASAGDLQGRPVPGASTPFSDATLGRLWVGHRAEMFAACLACVIGHAVAALVLIRSAIRRYDESDDRPAGLPAPPARRPRAATTPHAPRRGGATSLRA